MKSLKFVLLLTFVLGVSACSHTSVRHHQDFQEAAKGIETVVIIPAEVEIELVNFTGDNELLEDEATSIKAKIHALATDKLTSEKLSVIEFNFDKEISEDESFAYAITQAKEAWAAAKGDMYKVATVPEKEKANFQSNLGSVLNSIADKTNADAVLFMNYSGFQKSEGMIAKDLASSVLVGVLTLGAVVPVQAMAGSFIDIALIDTTSGKIIWANRKNGASVDDSVAKVAFKEFPDLVWKS